MLGCGRDAAGASGCPDRGERLSSFVRRRLLLRDRGTDGGDSLELSDDGVIAGHEMLAIGKAVRAAVPHLHAANEIVCIGVAIEPLPGPKRRADLRLHIELRRHGRHLNDRKARQILQGFVAIPARPLRPAPANEGRSVRRARPVAHAGAVDVVKGMPLPAGRLPVLGDDRRRALEAVRPDLRHPRGRVIDVLGQVWDGEPTALVLDIGEEERETVPRRIDPRLRQHVLLCHEGVQDHLRGARKDRPHRLFGQLDGH